MEKISAKPILTDWAHVTTSSSMKEKVLLRTLRVDPLLANVRRSEIHSSSTVLLFVASCKLAGRDTADSDEEPSLAGR